MHIRPDADLPAARRLCGIICIDERELKAPELDLPHALPVVAWNVCISIDAQSNHSEVTQRLPAVNSDPTSAAANSVRSI